MVKRECIEGDHRGYVYEGFTYRTTEDERFPDYYTVHLDSGIRVFMGRHRFKQKGRRKR